MIFFNSYNRDTCDQDEVYYKRDLIYYILYCLTDEMNYVDFYRLHIISFTSIHLQLLFSTSTSMSALTSASTLTSTSPLSFISKTYLHIRKKQRNKKGR